MSKFAKEGSNVKKGTGSKPGAKDSGSVGDLHQTASVTHNETEKNVEFAKGGDTPMFGEQVAGSRTAADKSASTGKPDSSGPGEKYAEGGKTKMFGFAGSQPARAGITSAR